MLYIKKLLVSLNQNYLSMLLVIFALALASDNLQATECGIFKIQKNRSSGTSVINNNCANANELSLQATLEIQGNTRVWLESLSAFQDADNLLIICQNRSLQSINIQINSPLSPWINLKGAGLCDSWVNQRLECREANTNTGILFCAATQINTASENETTMQRRSSITLRGLTQNKNNTVSLDERQPEINKWKISLKPEIDLCRKVFQVNQPITLSWKIKAAGGATDTKIAENGIDDQFAECTTEVIENFGFPSFGNDSQISISF